MGKNLIYYSVGISGQYGEMVKISIDSLDRSNPEILDVLIITDQNFYDSNFREYPRPNTFFHIVDPINFPDETCFNKLRVFEYSDVKNYDNILYLDSDTLVNYSLGNLFEKCNIEGKLYAVVQDYSIEIHRAIQFGLGNYTQEEIDFFRRNEVFTFNCGFFLFKNSPPMRKHFRNVYDLMINYEGEYFSDQSFVNYYFNSYFLTITNVVRKEIDLVYIVDENVNFISDLTQKIFHFLGNTYSGVSKIDKIKEFYKRIKND